MADVKQLAIRAKAILDRGDALNVVTALYKAIIGEGIRNKADVKRLMSQVGTQYNRDRNDEQRPARRRA